MRKPDWRKWSLCPEIQLFEAVALWVDIEPADIEKAWRDNETWLTVSQQRAESEFYRRLHIAVANLGQAKPLNPVNIVIGAPGRCSVSLAQFAGWAGSLVSKGFSAPIELLELARNANATAAKTLETQEPAPPRPHAEGTPKRSNVLDHVIETARNATGDRDNYQVVWAELVRMATFPQCPAPLLGYADGEVKYQDVSGIRFFTKDALRKRLGRAST